MAKPRKPASARASSSSSSSCTACFALVAVLSLLAVAAAVALRWVYPSEQRCPPEDDRFHDHCKEGRTHYMIQLDWACLGPERSQLMRKVLAVEDDDANQETGSSWVPSWLTSTHANVVEGSVCVNAVRPDRGCWYCKKSPRTALQAAAAEESAAAAAERAEQAT